MATTAMSIGIRQAVDKLGFETAARLYGAYTEAIELIDKLVTEEGIDCDFARTGKLNLATKPAHYQGFAKTAKLLNSRLGGNSKLVPKAELRREIGTDVFHGGMVESKSAGLHVGKYIRGLGEAAERAGVTIHEEAPVRKLTRVGSGHELETPRGRIRANQVLLATGAYTRRPFYWHQVRIAPVGSLNSFDEIKCALGPIPLGPVVGGKPLDGEGMISVVEPGHRGGHHRDRQRHHGRGNDSRGGSTLGAGRLGRNQPPVAQRDLAPRVRPHDRARGALARLVVLENGKGCRMHGARSLTPRSSFAGNAEEAVRLGGVIEHAPAGTKKIMVLRQPIGVSLLITPWNFPAAMATRKIGPALAAGCSVILKPASETPLTALAIVAILAEAGVPDGVVNIVPSTRSNDLSSALLDQPPGAQGVVHRIDRGRTRPTWARLT
jgi:glycine/D-amino acid oxidase-like deaminating enzyme